jgi:uncharacterized protein (DUF58 family)
MSLHQGDRVGLVVFADEVKAMLKRSSAMSLWRQIVGALSTEPVNKPTNMARVIDQTLGKLTNRCLIALVSDLFVDPEEYRTALARIRHKRHDLIVMQIVDNREKEFDLRDVAPFEGLEGEAKIRVDPRAIRDAYKQVFAEHLEEIERITRSFNFDYQLVNTHDWLGPPMAAFLAKRNAQIKRSKFG